MVDRARLQSFLAYVDADSSPVMLFGSVARGDDSPESDVDLLEISGSGIRHSRRGAVQLYTYEGRLLRLMGLNGSLFILHLRTEGVSLRGGDIIEDILGEYRPPQNYRGHRRSLAQIGKLLDVQEHEYLRSWGAYNDTAVFVTRTLLFVEQAELGAPSFSLSEIARRTGQSGVRELAALKRSSRPDWARFQAVRSQAERAVGLSFRNEFVTVEALLASLGGENPSLMSFGLRVLGMPDPKLGYDLLDLTPFG